MATITFDTLKHVERLEQAGLPRDQAVAIAETQKQALTEAMDSQLATSPTSTTRNGNCSF